MEFNDYYQSIKSEIDSFVAESSSADFPWMHHLILAPKLFLLICRLSQNQSLPVKDKAHLSSALAYFVSPVDFIPEETEGTRGYLDDVILSAHVLYDILQSDSGNFIQEIWDLEQSPEITLQAILSDAEEMVGREIYHSLITLART